jgi:hypothetical protein
MRDPLPHLMTKLLATALAFAATWASAGPITPDLPAIMQLTAAGWTASQSEGFLPYGFDFLSDTPIEPNRMSAPNLIRQTSSAFAFASYYDYTRDERLRDPLRRALAAFGAHSLPIGKGVSQRMLETARILSLPVGRWKLQSALERFGLLYQPSGDGKVVTPDRQYGNALAGTAALALLTEVLYARASGDESFAHLRTAWLEGLLSLRIPGGGFRQNALSIDDSDYGNGEAWLALAVYGDGHRDDADAMAVLSDVDDALMRRYSEKPSVYFFGWGAMAAAQRYRTTREPRFLNYVRRQGDYFVEQFERRFNSEDNNCAAMEGVSSALVVLKAAGESDSKRVREMQNWLSDEIAKLPKLQIQPGQRGMALGGEAYLRAPRMADYAGGFLAGVYTPLTRIDAAGHCLSAMVTIEREHLR